MYITTIKKVGDVIAEAHKTQLDQNVYPFPFSGSFLQDSLTSPVPCQLKSSLNILLQGPSVLKEEHNEQQEEKVKGRQRIANTIAHQIIYNCGTGSNYVKSLPRSDTSFI